MKIVRAGLVALVLAACEDELPPIPCGGGGPIELIREFSTTADFCFEDPNGDMLAYMAVAEDPGIASVSLSGTTLHITGESWGSTIITVTATDPGGLTGTLVYDVTVKRAIDTEMTSCQISGSVFSTNVVIQAWAQANIDVVNVNMSGGVNLQQVGSKYIGTMFTGERENVRIEGTINPPNSPAICWIAIEYDTSGGDTATKIVADSISIRLRP